MSRRAHAVVVTLLLGGLTVNGYNIAVRVQSMTILFAIILLWPALAAAQQPFYTERIVHLPDCFQPNDATRAVAPLPVA